VEGNSDSSIIQFYLEQRYCSFFMAYLLLIKILNKSNIN
jgi:hypothetical protein